MAAMRHRVRALLAVFLMLCTTLVLSACDDGPDRRLVVMAGSEARTLEPLLAEFERDTGIQVDMRYLGSVEIMLALQQGRQAGADAVWPAHSLWLTLGDTQRVVNRSESIMRSPVVIALKRSVVRDLGWEGRRDLAVEDFVAAAATGRLRFAMTSATQSNSGAMAYLGFLHAIGATGDVLTPEDLKDPATRDRMRTLLGAVDRSSGSSGWLKDMLLTHYADFDGMVNYEAVVIETNQEITARGQEPLCALYPRDALAIADHPLALIDRSGEPGFEQVRADFTRLQDWLLSDPVQARIRGLGRRTGPVGIAMADADPAVFNPDWCIDTDRVISPVRLPDEGTIKAALTLYQEGLRKPSDTVFLLDVSGSMEGQGLAQMKQAMQVLLDPAESGRYLIQPGARDRITVIAFNSETGEPVSVRGDDGRAMAGLLADIRALQAGGGTDFYPGVLKAMEILSRATAEGRLPAIVLMTDGKSETDRAGPTLEALRRHPPARNIPVFAITFGEADPSQLEELATASAGRVFDGRRDLARAFRDVRGYN